MANRIRIRYRLAGSSGSVERTFPYVLIVFKEVVPDLILVSAIFHTSRNPRKKYWRWPLDTD